MNKRKDNLFIRSLCVIASWMIHFPLIGLEVPWHINAHFLVAFQHRLFFIANHWHNSNGHIIVRRISTSPINSRGHPFQLSNPKRRELKALKEIKKLIILRASTNFTELLSHIDFLSYRKSVSLRYFYLCCGQDVCGWADRNPVQKECPSHTDLLECFLQLWTLHSFPWTYNFGLAMSNKLNT